MGVLVNELRSKIKQLPEPEAAGQSEAERTWVRNRNRLRQLILEDDVSNFLNWDVIKQTMFYEPPVLELEFLQKLPNWNKWEKAIRESRVGKSKPYPGYSESSGNLIHQAYNLAQLVCTTGCAIEDMSQIIDFGGGYGCMCRLVHQLGFKGRYIIFDLPELLALQEYYLKSVGAATSISTKITDTENCIILLSDYNDLAKQLQKQAEPCAFIATWSISEAPPKLRNEIFALISNPTYLLIAYQEQFRDINNSAYFAELIRSSSDYCWHDYPIRHLKGNRYLIGARNISLSEVKQPRSNLQESKPIVTVSGLGSNGRFGNQLFQYAFLKIYAKEHNLEVLTPPWIGQYLFGHRDGPILQHLDEVKETSNDLSEAVIPNTKERLENVDLHGYFQYHSSYYAAHKGYFRRLFEPVAAIREQLEQVINRLRARARTLVGLHLRRGDYGQGYFFVAPNEWYRKWLEDLWGRLDKPLLFIASDEPEEVAADFAKYNPVTSRQLGLDWPVAGFYPDFYILSQCDIVGISNSSFSFLACMLNERGKMFYRPRLSQEALIPFDPWASEPILRDETVSKVFYTPEQVKQLREANCHREAAEELARKAVELLRIGAIYEALDYFDGASSLHAGLAEERCCSVLSTLDEAKLSQIEAEAGKKLIVGPRHQGAKLLLKYARGQLESRDFFKTGVNELRLAKAGEALSCFDKALAGCAELPNLHFARATALVQLGKLGSAKAACLAELRLQPGHDGAKRLLERIERAIEEFEEIKTGQGQTAL